MRSLDLRLASSLHVFSQSRGFEEIPAQQGVNAGIFVFLCGAVGLGLFGVSLLPLNTVGVWNAAPNLQLHKSCELIGFWSNNVQVKER